jgi:isopenicillin-N epimerase
VWPLMAAEAKQGGDIRKFEEIGTHPAANHNAVAEALVFHRGIGVERKAARLRYLRDRWMRRLQGQPRVRIHTSFDPAMSCGIGNVQVEGVDSQAVARHLFDTRRIIVVPINHAEFEGIRVTPCVYTTTDEVDLFAEEMEKVIAKGLPAQPTGSRARPSPAGTR